MVPGEPFSLKVFARLINGLGVHEVQVFDPHSDVAPALIDRCRVLGNGDAATAYIRATLSDRSFVLIAPDAGAYKKTERLASALGVPVVVATKYRSVIDGSLAAPDVLGDVQGRVCVIVDDICDGGGTFLNLAEALTNAGAAECHLFVSHGIFSKGFEALRARFASIGTTDAFRDASEYPQDITVITLSA
jgi:ribose-phosphate pyrophosphokinase